MTTQRVFVTGGAGFIGSHTVDLLLQQNKQVVVLDNLFSGKLTNLNMQHPNLEFIEGDILEYPLVEELVANCDAVLHLAAIASVQLSIDDPMYSFQVNSQGFLHILEAIRRAKRSIRLVYASSAAVYGNAQSLPCRDEIPLISEVLSPYALQKKNNEEYATVYAHLHGIKSLGLRYFNVYGVRQDPSSPYSGVISKFLASYKENAPLVIFGDGKQSRDFIYVSDLARANALALESQFTGALNVATGKAQTLLDMVHYLELAGGRPAEVRFEPARAGDIRASYAEVKAAEQHLGFKASVSLEEGMRRLAVQ